MVTQARSDRKGRRQGVRGLTSIALGGRQFDRLLPSARKEFAECLSHACQV